MITREQVKDLQPGDVVRVTGWQGLTLEGPLSTSKYSDTLWLGEYLRLTCAALLTDVGDTLRWLATVTRVTP